MSYEARAIKAPRMAGRTLKVAASLAENPLTGTLLADAILDSAGILELRGVPAGNASPLAPGLPRDTAGGGQPGGGGDSATSPEGPVPFLDEIPELGPPPRGSARKPGGFGVESAADIEAAYREGSLHPVTLAERVLAAVAASEAREPPMRLLVAQDAADFLAQARASEERWRAGRPLSPLDGIPVVVKDELDQRGYPTRVGTRFLGGAPAAHDAEAVARLRAAGALLVGKANMHEIGLGVTGINPHHGATRNPYEPARVTGGSSSGPAASVAAGLCPIAVGADGGGSIRIPAALCGVVGLKPTFGRVSGRGAAPLCWSVAHVGPIAATVRDAALAYACMAGPDLRDPLTLGQPRPHLDGIFAGDLEGVRLGMVPAWFDDADAEVVAACRHLLDGLRGAGAEVCEIDIPDLHLVRAVHLVILVGEMTAAHLHHYPEHRTEYAADTRLNLALGRRLTAYDYVHAQRHRARITAHFAAALRKVDAIVTPATACTAPAVPPDALAAGESDLEVVERLMRFAPAANLTGLPAIAFPAGYDAAGLPIGLQVMGRAFEEHLILRVAAVAETLVPRRPPRVYSRLLS